MADHAALEPCPNPWCLSRWSPDEADGPDVCTSRASSEFRVSCASCPMSGPWADTIAEAKAAWNTRPADPKVEKLLAFIENPPRHIFWGAGEPDCPKEIKASNGEIWKLRCKSCGQDNPKDAICRAALDEAKAQSLELLWFAQQIFNGIDTGMLRLETPADETLETLLRRGRAAISETKAQS